MGVGESQSGESKVGEEMKRMMMKWQMDEEVLIDDRRATDDCRNTHCGADDEPAAPDDDEEEARMSWEVGVEVVQISLQGACAGYSGKFARDQDDTPTTTPLRCK